MVIKWIFKAMLSLVLAVLILLYPHKVAGITVAALGAAWDVAVTIGRNLHVPGVEGAVVLPLLGFVGSKIPFADLNPNPQGEIQND